MISCLPSIWLCQLDDPGEGFSCFRLGFYQFGSKSSFLYISYLLRSWLRQWDDTEEVLSHGWSGWVGNFLTGISVSLVGEFVGLDVFCTGCARVCLDSVAVLSFYQAVDDS